MSAFDEQGGANPANPANQLAPLAGLAGPVPATTRDASGRFLTGNSGGGRPKGSRNRLSDVLLSTIVEDFAEHGSEVVARLRQHDPATYLRLVSSLVPRELVMQREQRPDVDYAELTDDELYELMQKQRRRKFVDRALDSV